MNTNDVNKAVCIFNFSIYGVGGFQTVSVLGSKPLKRMLAAINHMHGAFKEREKEFSQNCDVVMVTDADAKSTIAREEEEEWRKVRQAIRLLTTIKDRILNHQDVGQLTVVDKSYTISTEQFFSEASYIYKENVNTFLSKLREIDIAIDKYLAGKLQVREESVPAADMFPSIYVCLGGIFGHKSYYLFMTPLDIRQMGNGDLTKAIHYFVNNALETVKNIKLSEYLRFQGEQQEKIKQDILFLDQLMDTVSDIKVVNTGMILSSNTMAHCGVSNGLSRALKDTVDTLMIEGELRLKDYVTSLLPSHQK